MHSLIGFVNLEKLSKVILYNIVIQNYKFKRVFVPYVVFRI